MYLVNGPWKRYDEENPIKFFGWAYMLLFRKSTTNFPDTRRVYIFNCYKTYRFAKRLYCNFNDTRGYTLTCYTVVNTRWITFWNGIFVVYS